MYLLFGFGDHYPHGGIDDLVGKFTLSELKQKLSTYSFIDGKIQIPTYKNNCFVDGIINIYDIESDKKLYIEDFPEFLPKYRAYEYLNKSIISLSIFSNGRMSKYTKLEILEKIYPNFTSHEIFGML
jgi:hypothetical protein